LLTAKTEETDKIVGLAVGADDYVTKPFSPRELTARIKAALRRLNLGGQQLERNVLSYKQITIELGSRKIRVNDQEIELTAMEFDLLAALAQHPGLVFSREQLLEKVWGHDYFGELRVVDVHIGHIRQKLGDDRFIDTVRSVGYRFEYEWE
jgi:two-component system alkaline phosphatase synthesis response regulator PhoP